MKKLIMFALSFIMAVTYGFAWTGPSYAANADKSGIKDPVKVSSSEYKEHEALVMFKTKKSVSQDRAKSKLSSGKYSIDGVKIVDSWKFTEPVPAGGADKQKGKKGSERLGAGSAGYANIVLVRSDSLSTKQLVNKLKKRSDVLYAEPNYKIHALSLSDDPYADYQWGFEENAGNVGYQWNNVGVKGSDNIVAVVDTGVDYTHEDLADNMWENDNYPKLKGEHGFDIIMGDDDPMDENGHGTHCAGIIGAVGDNGIGVSGVNQKIKIMALRILDEEGSGYNSEEIGAYNYISKALDLGEPVTAINNSWGGGEESDIFAELVDIVGEKGAVTVCAAGNDGLNNDEEGDYPSNIDSDYIVSVAATREDGQLASFSNYGSNSVDVAAPGTDILSTVFYDCYNPGVYLGSQFNETTSLFNNYEDGEVWGVPEDDDISLPEGASCDVSVGSNGFVSDSALKLDFQGLKTDDMAFISIPYTLSSEDPEYAPYASFMAQTVTPDTSDMWDMSFLVAVDVPADVEVTKDSIENYSMEGYYISGEQDDWNHYSYACLQDENSDSIATDRKVVLAVYAAKGGDYTIYLDDLGISKDTASPESFGKYDFMSGTSMATPFVSGAVALKKAELGNVDALTLINETVSLVKDSPELPVAAGSSFDFSQKPAEPSPRIASVQIGEEPGTILIKGSGLNPSSGLKVELSYAEMDEFEEAQIIEQKDDGTEVVIKDQGWINNYVDIKVTGYNGRTVQKSNVYLVKGKGKYELIKGAEGISETAKLATDGDRIYKLSSEDDAVYAFDPAKPNDGFIDVADVDYSELFTEEENDTAMYDMLFSRDMAIVSDTLYTVVEYGEGVEGMSDDDEFWIIFSNAGKYRHKVILADEDEDYDDEEYAACGALYSSEMRLVGIDLSKGTVTDMGALPEDLEKTMDWSLASYNGKLYFMGGYSMDKATKGLTKAVKVFDPATEEWSEGPDMPKAAAFGQALQTGDSLVYTLGYSEDQTGLDVEEQECPANMIFNGSSWKESTQELVPLSAAETVKRGSDEYILFDGNIGVVKGGIVYIGMPAMDYGDTVKYDVDKDAFEDTGFNYYTRTEDIDLSGIVAGENIYAFDSDESVSTAPVETGFIEITCGKIKHGKVTGVNRFYNPGDMAKITAKGTGKYKVKSMKVGSKKVKIKKKVKSKTYITPPLTEDLEVKVKFKK